MNPRMVVTTVQIFYSLRRTIRYYLIKILFLVRFYIFIFVYDTFLTVSKNFQRKRSYTTH